MNKFISMLLAVFATLCLLLTGVAIGEESTWGIIVSLLAAFSIVGLGIKLKKAKE